MLWELSKHKNYVYLYILAYLILLNVIRTDCVILSKVSTNTTTPLCGRVCGFPPLQNSFNSLRWQTSAENGETESTYLVDVTCYILWGFFPTVIYDFWHLNCVGHYHFIIHALLRKNCMAKHLKDFSQVYSLGYGIIFIVIKTLKMRRSNHLNTEMFLL